MMPTKTTSVEKLHAETFVVPVVVLSSNLIKPDVFGKHKLFCSLYKKDIDFEKFEELAKRHKAMFNVPEEDENCVVNVNFKVPYVNSFVMLKDRQSIEVTELKQQPAVILAQFRIVKTKFGVFATFSAKAVKIVDDVPVLKHVKKGVALKILLDFEIENNMPTSDENGVKETKAPWDF